MITKIALSAAKMRAPFLSEGALKKLQDAGIIKSVDDLLPGWKEGSKNLAKRYDADITTLPEKHPVINNLVRAVHGGAVTYPGGDFVREQYKTLVPEFIKKHITDKFGKTVAQLPADTAIIAHGANVSGNAAKDLLRTTGVRHELLEAKYAPSLLPKVLKSVPHSFFVTPEKQKVIASTLYRKQPELWTKYNNAYALDPTVLNHASSHVLRGERKFLMESGHPELLKGSILRRARTNTGEADSFRKITGNDDMYGSLAKQFDASKYTDMTNGAIRKQLAHDDRALRHYIDKKELTPLSEAAPNNITYTLPGDPGPGLLRDKVIPFLEKKLNK